MGVTHWGPCRPGETQQAFGQECISTLVFDNNDDDNQVGRQNLLYFQMYLNKQKHKLKFNIRKIVSRIFTISLKYVKLARSVSSTKPITYKATNPIICVWTWIIVQIKIKESIFVFWLIC